MPRSQPPNSIALSIIAVIFVTLGLMGCSSSEDFDAQTPEGGFKLAERYEKSGRYEDAITQFNLVRNKHPYSRLATEAALRVADLHYKREDFLEAQSAYQAFKELYPTFPRIDYVTYQLAMSYYKQLPSTIDRDLSIGNRALLYFDEVLQSYSQSTYASQAKENKINTQRMLAEKENYIAYFYFVRRHFAPALARYEELLTNYPDLGLEPEALYRASLSALRLREYRKAREHYNRLQTSYGDSTFARKAEREIGHELESNR